MNVQDIESLKNNSLVSSITLDEKPEPTSMIFDGFT